MNIQIYIQDLTERQKSCGAIEEFSIDPSKWKRKIVLERPQDEHDNVLLHAGGQTFLISMRELKLACYSL